MRKLNHKIAFFEQLINSGFTFMLILMFSKMNEVEFEKFNIIFINAQLINGLIIGLFLHSYSSQEKNKINIDVFIYIFLISSLAFIVIEDQSVISIAKRHYYYHYSLILLICVNEASRWVAIKVFSPKITFILSGIRLFVLMALFPTCLEDDLHIELLMCLYLIIPVIVLVSASKCINFNLTTNIMEQISYKTNYIVIILYGFIVNNTLASLNFLSILAIASIIKNAISPVTILAQYFDNYYTSNNVSMINHGRIVTFAFSVVIGFLAAITILLLNNPSTLEYSGLFTFMLLGFCIHNVNRLNISELRRSKRGIFFVRNTWYTFLLFLFFVTSLFYCEIDDSWIYFAFMLPYVTFAQYVWEDVKKRNA